MCCGHWGANFVEYDLCSGCGGGGVPWIHHRSAGDRTLLVCDSVTEMQKLTYSGVKHGIMT